MKINYNMSAYVANARLLQNEDMLTQSLERLSSGYRINHASDDPAGMAISSKMKSQIRGLDQANRNSKDGISVLETTEGALSEVNSILQRMRELAVQSGNDTYTQEDLQAMQDEIEELKEEIDRISKDTEFNKLRVLDGSMSSRIYANTREVTLMEASSNLRVGDYNFTVQEEAKKAFYQGTAVTGADLNGNVVPKGMIDINGYKVRFTGEENNAEEIFEKLRDACEIGEVTLTAGAAGDESYTFGKILNFESKFEGLSEKVEIKCDNEDIAKFFGIPTTLLANGEDAKVTADPNDFSPSATLITKGNRVTITERNGVSLGFTIEEGALERERVKTGNATASLAVELNVTDVGKMVFQVGANEKETISISIPEVSTRTLYIDEVDVTTINGTDRSLLALDNALAKVTAIRSEIGATQNRLDYATDNLDEVTGDMTSALSRIEDVDMATEMSTYTQMNVLVQAATSVLGQANDIPEQVLQLLQ